MQELDFLTEVLDLKTSKSYEYTISPDSDIPTWATPIAFQATFQSENGKEYAVRVFKDKKYGIHSRGIVVMLKKQSKWTQNLIVDPNTFKKVIVTMFKIYDEYKDTNDGKMTSSFMLVLQKGVADRAGLIVKALNRAFKSQPKKKLDLYAANEEGKGNVSQIFFVNPSSVYPFFQGKAFDDAWKTSPLFKMLSGTTDDIVVSKGYDNIVVNNAPDENVKLPIEIEYKYVKLKTQLVDTLHRVALPKGSLAMINLSNGINLKNDMFFVTARYKSIASNGNYNSESIAPGEIAVPVTYQKVFEPIPASEYYDAGIVNFSPAPNVPKVSDTDVKFDETFRYFKNTEPLLDASLSKLIPAGSYFRVRTTIDDIKKMLDGTLYIRAKYKVIDQDEETSDVVLPKDYQTRFVAITPDEYEAGPSAVSLEPKIDVAYMLQDSGSSKLKKGGSAEVVEHFISLSKQSNLVSKFNLLNVVASTDDSGYIVKPFGIDSYVALFSKDEGVMYTISTGTVSQIKGIEAATSNPEEGTVKNYNDKTPPATNENPVASIYTKKFVDEVNEIDRDLLQVELAPGVNISLQDYDPITFARKVREITALFGSDARMESSKILRMIRKLDDKSTIVGKRIENMIMRSGYYLKSGSYGVPDVKAYSGNDYNRINKLLRNPENYKNEYGEGSYKGISKRITGIDKAFSLYGIRLPNDLPVYRGASISTKEIEDLSAGKSYEMISYTSASLRTSTATSFAKFDMYDAVLTISGNKNSDQFTQDSQQGNKIFMTIKGLDQCLSLYIADISNHPGELELLINRGTKVRTDAGQPLLLLFEGEYNKVKTWSGQLRVAGGLNESVRKSFANLLEQKVPGITEMFDAIHKIGMLQFALDALKDDLEYQEVENM